MWPVWCESNSHFTEFLAYMQCLDGHHTRSFFTSENVVSSYLLSIKGAMSRYFKSFLWWPVLSEVLQNLRKMNGFAKEENTKGVILKQKETRMAEDGEDWNGLEMMILKSLVIFFKIHKWWHSSFKWTVIKHVSNNFKVKNYFIINTWRY